jgi:hypothetical protein
MAAAAVSAGRQVVRCKKNTRHQVAGCWRAHNAPHVAVCLTRVVVNGHDAAHAQLIQPVLSCRQRRGPRVWAGRRRGSGWQQRWQRATRDRGAPGCCPRHAAGLCCQQHPQREQQQRSPTLSMRKIAQVEGALAVALGQDQAGVPLVAAGLGAWGDQEGVGGFERVKPAARRSRSPVGAGGGLLRCRAEPGGDSSSGIISAHAAPRPSPILVVAELRAAPLCRQEGNDRVLFG